MHLSRSVIQAKILTRSHVGNVVQVLKEQKFVPRKALSRRHHMLLLKRLGLASLGVVELHRWVISIKVVMLLLLLLWLEGWRGLRE